MRRETNAVPDGGWGWVIVACSFLIHMFVVGTLYALSVLYVSWLDAFDNSKGYTSWIISLAVAVMFGNGPLPGFMSRRFSNRATVIAGGFLMFLGFLSSVFARSVLHLICSVGIVTGIGAGCCYLPSVSMVAMYFNKKRSIAMGISSAGLGVGAFLMPLYLNWMVMDYGWRGCMLILSALSLNMCVLGVLMRPLEPGQGFPETYGSDVLYVEKVTPLSSNEYSFGAHSPSDENVHFCDECSSTYYSQLDETSSFIGCKHHALPVIEISLLDKHDAEKEVRSGVSGGKIVTQYRPESREINASSDSGKLTMRNKICSNKQLRNSAMHLSEVKCQEQVNKSDNKVGGSLQCIKNDLSDSNNSHSQNLATSLASLAVAGAKGPAPHSPSSSLSSIQIMMSGNIYNALHSCRAVNSLMSLQSDNPSQKRTRGCSMEKSNNQYCVENFDDSVVNKMLEDSNNNDNSATQQSDLRKMHQKLASALGVYLSLIKNGTFMVFCISNFLTNLSFFMPVLYMVDRAIDEGISKNEAAILVSLYGAGNIFGKLFFGWLADTGIVDRLVIYIGCLTMAGVATCLSPLCGEEQALHGMYSFSFGCFIGSYCTLYSLVTVDLVGLEFVDESVGVILCFMGVATAFGSPLAGWIFDWTGSYAMAYGLHGVFILLSAAMMIPIFVQLRWKRKI